MMLLGDLQHSEQIFRASWHSVTESRSSSLFALNVSLQAQSQKPLTWHSLKSSWNFQECHPVLLITETRGEDLIITEVRKSVSWRSEVCPNYNCWGAHEPEPEATLCSLYNKNKAENKDQTFFNFNYQQFSVMKNETEGKYYNSTYCTALHLTYCRPFLNFLTLWTLTFFNNLVITINH